VKWIENDFLAMEKIFTQLKGHFLSFSQANMKFSTWDKIFCPAKKIVRTRNILSRQMHRA